MTTVKYTFTKDERLSWKRHIDTLFAQGKSFIAFPLRVVYFPVPEAMPARSAVLCSVSKKKFKHAVERNRIKRLIRECYRLHKHPLLSALEGKNKYISVAFIYLESKECTFEEINKGMAKAIRLLCEKA